MTEALRLRLQAEAEMWRQRGDAHLCALLDDASAALAQPSATSAEPADEPLRVAHISLYTDGRMTAAYMLEDGAKMLALLLEDARLTWGNP